MHELYTNFGSRWKCEITKVHSDGKYTIVYHTAKNEPEFRIVTKHQIVGDINLHLSEGEYSQ